METEQKVLPEKEIQDGDEEERKHFCKVINAFRFYRLGDEWSLAGAIEIHCRIGG